MHSIDKRNHKNRRKILQGESRPNTLDLLRLYTVPKILYPDIILYPDKGVGKGIRIPNTLYHITYMIESNNLQYKELTTNSMIQIKNKYLGRIGHKFGVHAGGE